jgi:hypothetical protein
MDLRFDDHDRRAKLTRSRYRFMYGKSRLPARHRNAKIPQQRLGLVFVNVHTRLSRDPNLLAKNELNQTQIQRGFAVSGTQGVHFSFVSSAVNQVLARTFFICSWSMNGSTVLLKAALRS